MEGFLVGLCIVLLILGSFFGLGAGVYIYATTLRDPRLANKQIER